MVRNGNQDCLSPEGATGWSELLQFPLILIFHSRGRSPFESFGAALLSPRCGFELSWLIVHTACSCLLTEERCQKNLWKYYKTGALASAVHFCPVVKHEQHSHVFLVMNSDVSLIGSALSVLICMCMEAASSHNLHSKQLDMACALQLLHNYFTSISRLSKSVQTLIMNLEQPRRSGSSKSAQCTVCGP